MPELVIDGRTISESSKAYLVMDIGHNPQGNLTLAKEMVLAAKESGADAMKFQTRHPRDVYSVAEYNRVSDNPNWFGRTYGEHREHLEFSQDEWEQLLQFCKDEEVTAFSTPFDFKSVDQLEQLDVPAFKVASGDATNIPMIEYIAKTNKPMLVSTGGCTMPEVQRVYDAVMPINGRLAILQCSCVYPAPPEIQNVRVVGAYQDAFPDILTGLSSHNPNWWVNLAAYALGGRIFENHFTTDRTLKGTDHVFSLTPDMLKEYRSAIDEVAVALGSAEKFPMPVEEAPTLERRKKLIWAKDLEAGHVVAPADIALKCPGDGVEPWMLTEVYGRRLKQPVAAESSVELTQVPENAKTM